MFAPRDGLLPFLRFNIFANLVYKFLIVKVQNSAIIKLFRGNKQKTPRRVEKMERKAYECIIYTGIES